MGLPLPNKRIFKWRKSSIQSRTRNYYIDIIFLDIELGKSNGVDIAKTIRKHSKDTIIIFVTGFSDYVFHGYDVGALNYILKPYKTEKYVKY
uniref:Stage 0 sporulation protein A homolog n=1 Tax=Clostridioides difficile TaxID=1496 RepID=A0A381I787_CLODI|nr:two-component response regulator [Clostridioides difficile]